MIEFAYYQYGIVVRNAKRTGEVPTRLLPRTCMSQNPGGGGLSLVDGIRGFRVLFRQFCISMGGFPYQTQCAQFGNVLVLLVICFGRKSLSLLEKKENKYI